MLQLKGQISIKLPILKDLTESFPLTLGALTLTSKDEQRNYILDSISSNYENGFMKETVMKIDSVLEADLDTFEQDEEINYNLTLEDLKDCKGSFYCSDVDNEDGEDCFEYGKAEAIVIITDLETGIEYKISVNIEQ